ncbi:L,D-transpeptidase family protein [Massilia sp. TWR1-2-2]|uniref:L,D-transpeptidase family protein n=1 Tax=Massilia sp. TWR1-2-2 TaxID=2804584 RepID=UPI003CE8A124
MKTSHTVLAACLTAAFSLPAFAAAPAAASAAALSADSVNAAGKSEASGKAAKPGKANILRAQIMLDRAHFSSGEIDGAAGSNLRAAIAGYQSAKGIESTGAMNPATWAALNADSADALTTYTIADADVAGPFEAIPENMADKAKMTALGYASAEEALGEKFHASPALLKRLNPGKDLSRAGEQIIVPNVLDTEPLPKGGKIMVDKSARTLTLFDTAGKAIAQFPASTGSEHDPLPVGNWKVKGIAKNPVFHYNPKLFWDADAGEKKAKIPAGPNNPVGVAWIDLSKPHYGIHGTPVPASIGKTQSHGCIRLTNWDVASLMASVGAGTDVVLQD